MTPPDSDGPSAKTKSAKSAADRVRAHYHRKKAKKRSLRGNYTEEYLDQLVGDGWIGAEQLTDPDILASVIEDRDERQKAGHFRPGPIVTGTSTSS